MNSRIALFAILACTFCVAAPGSAQAQPGNANLLRIPDKVYMVFQPYFQHHVGVHHTATTLKYGPYNTQQAAWQKYQECVAQVNPNATAEEGIYGSPYIRRVLNPLKAQLGRNLTNKPLRRNSAVLNAQSQSTNSSSKKKKKLPKFKFTRRKKK